jgi:hypothetical protein
MNRPTPHTAFALLCIALLSACGLENPTEEWDGPNVDHAEVSDGFALVGVHAQMACAKCHESGTFVPLFEAGSPDDCLACHQAAYEGQHADSGYPTDCSVCHPPTAWTNATFDHEVVSGGFQLLGTHAEKACTACHDATTFEALFDPADTNDCAACHRSDYEVSHVGSGYPTACSACHTPTVWADGIFDHEAISGGFQLLGTHASRPCFFCHEATTFEPLFDPADATDCAACHQADYDRQHAGSGYPTNCSACHTPTTWTDGTFNHELISGGFQLLGTHVDKACTACHDATNFEPLFDPADANDCAACHQADYDRQHAGSGYPTDCTVCHTPTTWAASSLNHDAQYFPIYSGKHDGKWSDCATCHTDPTDFAVFTCFNCHTHNQASMDNKHAGRAGYVYQSSACLSCHPDGSAD